MVTTKNMIPTNCLTYKKQIEDSYDFAESIALIRIWYKTYKTIPAIPANHKHKTR